MNEHSDQSNDAFINGFNDIPDNLDNMTYRQLASELSFCTQGTVKYIVIENALLRHEDSVNTKNTVASAKIGGFFTIAGVFFGFFLTLFISKGEPIQKIECICKTVQENYDSVNKKLVSVSEKLENKKHLEINNTP